MNPREEFLGLLAVAREAEHRAVGTSEFENELVAVLDFIKAHPDLRLSVIEEFSKQLRDRSFGPYTLIEFCMHDLRWPEILRDAEHIHAIFEVEVVRKKLHGTPSQHLFYLQDVISSFGEKWESEDLFMYYNK